jgi:ComF family protein
MPVPRWLHLLAPDRWPLPGGCWICRDWGRARLCDACLQRFALTQARCPRCALPLPQAPVCAACLRDPLPLQAVHAAVDYQPPWDGLLQALKYEQALGLAQPLAALVARDAPSPPPGCLLLPVPLHPRRLRERGYNQSQLLAQALAGRLALPVDARLIERIVDTPAQASLSRKERLANLRHAFALRGPAPTRPCLLIDDVMTTGATLATLATLLLAAGVPRVDAWVVARTPEPETASA